MGDKEKGDLSELANSLGVDHADLVDEGEAGEEDGVGPLVEDGLNLLDKVLVELGDLANQANGGEGGLLPDIGVGVGQEPLNLGAEIAGHLGGANVGQGGEGQSNNVDVGVVQVALRKKKKKKKKKEVENGGKRQGKKRRRG